MPKYLVTDTRQYDERWIIEAESYEAARSLNGTILDHDDGQGSDTGQSIEVEETYAEELP